MSKSILVIDTPEACIDCPCHFVEDTGIVWCGIKKKVLLAKDIEVFKPDWCPLRDLPEKKSPKKFCNVVNGRKLWGFHMSGFNKGFNACINEILKGENTE